MVINENDLNLDLLTRIISKEIDNYFENKIKRQDIEDTISYLEYSIHMLKIKDYLRIKNERQIFEQIFNSVLGEESTIKIIEKLDRYASICLTYIHIPKKDLTDDFNVANKKLDNIKAQLFEILISKKAEILSLGNQLTLEQIIELKRIRSNLKYGNLINSSQYELIKIILERKNLDTKTIIFFLEHIKNHNTKIHLKKKKKNINNNTTDRIMDMLSYGYEEITINDCNPIRKNQLDSTYNFIITISDTISAQELIELLPSYTENLRFTDNYELRDFNYLTNMLLKHYQSIMVNNRNLLNNYENYSDKEFRDMLVNEYYKNLNKYLKIREFSLQQQNLYKDDLNALDKNDSIPNFYRLKYATKEIDNPNKTHIATDLKGIPEDLYLRIKTLIIGFKKNILPNKQLKALNHRYSGLLEIKDDQIRILYKHLKDNEYIIMGVMIKKEDRASLLYTTIYDRNENMYVDEEEAEPIIFDNLENSYHNGGRKKS